ncbi:hypothetical protein ACFL1S_00255 [Pseudomonadota bacterium]
MAEWLIAFSSWSELLPQQLPGNTFAFEFLLNRGPARYLVLGRNPSIGFGINKMGQVAVIHIRWQGLGKPQRFGPGQQLLNSANAGFCTGFDLTYRQSGIVL